MSDRRLPRAAPPPTVGSDSVARHERASPRRERGARRASPTASRCFLTAAAFLSLGALRFLVPPTVFVAAATIGLGTASLGAVYGFAFPAESFSAAVVPVASVAIVVKFRYGSPARIVSSFAFFACLRCLVSLVAIRLADRDLSLPAYAPPFVVGYRQFLDAVTLDSLADDGDGERKSESVAAEQASAVGGAVAFGAVRSDSGPPGAMTAILGVSVRWRRSPDASSITPPSRGDCEPSVCPLGRGVSG